MQRSVPVLEGTRLIRLPPQNIEPYKQVETEFQVQELLEQHTIGSSNEAWTFSIFLVQNNS